MKKISIKFLCLLLSVLLVCTAFCGCSIKDTGGPSGTPSDGDENTLPAPVLSVDKEGIVSWDPVEGAQWYAYMLDNGEEKVTPNNSFKLTEGQSLKVKAVSGVVGVADSPYSEEIVYHKADTAELSFYAVNDLHGRFVDTSNQPGLDEFTTYVKNLYADPEREEVFLSSGDMWQGTVESSSNKGALMTEWMNDVGFVSMTLGNHEFDWGPDTLTPNSESAEFPFLALNVTYNGERPDYCKPSTVVERGGVKIGVIGAIGDCLSSISGEFQKGLSFATGGQLTALVKAEATRLRNEEQCDFIVYSIHDGGSFSYSGSGVTSVTNSDMSYYDTALSDGYVDLVFEAHTHRRYILRDEHGVYHMQADSENEYIACADVSFNKVTKTYTVSPRLISSNVYAKKGLEADPVVNELFTKYFPDDDPYTRIVGYNYMMREDTEIGERVAELYYEKGAETWPQYDIVLSGGYLKTRDPYDLAQGAVTYATLYSLLPFDNAIVLGRIRGSDLRRKFLQSSSQNYHTYMPASFASMSISDSETYYIVVDTYTAYYSWNNITEVARLDNKTYARDLLAEFLSEGGWA